MIPNARRIRAIAFASIAGLLAVARPSVVDAQAVASGMSWTRITYLSGASVYLEVGTRDGIAVGAHLDVVRGGAVVTTLVAEFVSSSRSACKASDPAVVLAVGDSVRFTAVVAARVPVPQAGSLARTESKARSSSRSRLRGRVGVRYLIMDLGTGTGSALKQPAFDLRLDGQELGDSPLGVVVDVRAQRSIFGKSAATSVQASPANVTRVYQAALLFHRAGAPMRVTLGRQFATALSTMGMFDGLALDIDHARMSYGALAGTEPDAASLSISSVTREYGAYVQMHNRPNVSPLWSLTLGGVGAYDNGEINREFAYLRSTFNSRHVSIFAAQELDINRGWKSKEEGTSATPTSTFAFAQISLSNALSLNGGVDNRRNVRLYRDYQNPESAFDDSFRQGMWGGLSLTALKRLRISADARTSSGGSSGASKSYTGSASVSRITRLQIALRARATEFTGIASQGRLESASIEVHPVGQLRIEYTAGARASIDPLTAARTQMTWTGVDADIGIGRSVYLMFSTSRESGPQNHTLLTYGSLSYRF